jgi:hypothetical protein
MDINSLFAQAGGTAGIITAIAVIYKAVNGKRCRSHCCGRNMEMDIKIDNVPPSPPDNETVVVNPMRPAS